MTGKRGRRKMLWLVPLSFIVLLLIALAVIVFHFRLLNLISRAPAEKRGRISWEDKGATFLGEKGYTPQGMAWVSGKILFANAWKDSKSRIYEIDPESMEAKRTFDMPQEAVHTSGLTWDGKLLWAVDYRSLRAYAVHLEESLASGIARLEGSFQTTLRGTSACCIVPVEGETYLAISDFMHSRKTIFVRREEALKKGTAENCIEFSYFNEGFSQGLEFAEGHLWESENKWGRNVINKMDIGILIETGSGRAATRIQYPAPSNGVEDLAWDGSALWTSDETVFRFFKGKIEP